MTRKAFFCITLFTLACVAAPLMAGGNNLEALDTESATMQVEPADGLAVEKAAECWTERSCLGLPSEHFARMIVQATATRLPMKSGVLKNAVVAYGCTETWSLWVHRDPNSNNANMLNQLVIAEATNSEVVVVFRKHDGHCDIDWVERVIS